MAKQKSEEELYKELNGIMTEVIADREDLRRSETLALDQFHNKVAAKKINNLRDQIANM